MSRILSLPVAEAEDGSPAARFAAACTVVPERRRVRLIPEGELDLSTVEGLSIRITELRAVGFCDLVLDLRRLRFMDVRGVHLLLQTDAQCREAGGELIVLATGRVRRVLDLCMVLIDVRSS